MKKWELYGLRFGAIQGVAMALYHFTLPVQFGWAQFAPEGAPTVAWALFALNNYFSFNLLVVAVTLGYFLFFRTDALTVILALSFLLISFWVFSVGYQLLRPMPLPERLNWLGFVLPGLALGNAVIIGLPAWRLARRSSRTSVDS